MICHSPAARALIDAIANEMTKARTDQRFTGRGMPARMVSRKLSNLKSATSAILPVYSKLTIDLVIFRAKNRKCFSLFDAPPLVSSHREKHFRRSEEHTSELQSHSDLVCRLLL